MGARTTWAIKTEEDSDTVIWLYSHSGGDSKIADTKEAIANAEPRWMDPSYGARIFISNIIGDSWSRETGYGITVGKITQCPFEEEYQPIVIDFTNQTVTVSGINTFSFTEFVESEVYSGLLTR